MIMVCIVDEHISWSFVFVFSFTALDVPSDSLEFKSAIESGCLVNPVRTNKQTIYFRSYAPQSTTTVNQFQTSNHHLLQNYSHLENHVLNII